MKHGQTCTSYAGCGAALALAALSLGSMHAAKAATCEARSPLTVVPVVELYTSEGCSSCPPADAWISKLRNEPQAVALSFHVDYWDYLGWKDRFAQPLFTKWQTVQLAVNGARNPYTPQVVINGVDTPRWYQQRATAQVGGATKAASVSLQLQREGGQYQATVLGLSHAPTRLAAYWAVTEGPQQTAVKAGENRGETLSHDFIVRELQPVSAWVAGPTGQHTLNFTPRTTPLETSLTRQVNLVVTDAQTGRPLQAIKLGC
jgi:hypothetical protein